eukprot:Hpha_TRINITY_DN16928_c2_g9::TRINITY_DN16928_c2_g9_i1::g.55420::m.55420
MVVDCTVYITKVCAVRKVADDCRAINRLFSALKISFTEVDIGGKANKTVRKHLEEAAKGFRSPPMVFVGKEYVGCWDDIDEWHECGTLREELRKAGYTEEVAGARGLKKPKRKGSDSGSEAPPSSSGSSKSSSSSSGSSSGAPPSGS